MSVLTYSGRVESGKLILDDYTKAKLAAEIKGLDGKSVELVIKKLPRRSNQQNAYYWGVVVATVKEGLNKMGHRVSNEDTHTFLKDRFNGTDIASIDGEHIGKIGGSTKLMNKAEFMEYLAKIQQFAAQYLGVVIPDPNEQMTIHF